jgi:glycosyltransferase involved in cell wall biosynthesis
MKVAVALATFNGARFLSEQLNSYLAQNRMPDELLVSDDSSADDTVQILRSFAQNAPMPVQIHVNPTRLGFVKNFATVLSLCNTDAIFMSDQDDVWFASKISTVLGAMERHPDKLLFVNDAELVGEDLSPTGLTIFGQKRPGRLAPRGSTYGCCFALRRELLDYVLPIPHAYRFHDKWIAHISQDLGVTHVIDRPLQVFRRHGSNASEISQVGPGDIAGRASELRTRVGADIRSYLRESALMTRLRVERLERLLDDGSLRDHALASNVPGRLRELRGMLEKIDARLALLEQPRVRRVPGVTRMLARGDYAAFSGVRSAVVDLLRK